MDLTPRSPRQSPAFRLVFPDHAPSLIEARARHAVAEENRRAASVAARDDPAAAGDVRRMFALRASQMLEGGRAAIMPPESRRMLVGDARRFGLRAFEANLIIAVVQDSTRRGESPVSAAAVGVLDVIPVGMPRREQRQLLVQRIIVASLVAVGLLSVLIRWVNGG